MTALGFTSPATFEQNRLNRQAFFQNLVMQGSAESVRKKAIETAKKEQEELRKKADQGGIFGGVVGAIGGGISGFFTGGGPAGALVGAVKGGLSGFQVGRETMSGEQGALIGALSGAGAGYQERIRQETEEKTFKLKGLESGLKSIEDKSKKEVKIRNEWAPFKKEFNKAKESKEIVESALNQGTAAGDITAIYNFIKLQDPNAVKEGEIALAQSAEGMFPKLWNYFNQAKTGVRLTSGQREDFANSASNIFSSKLGTFEKEFNEYKSISENQNLDLVNIFGKSADSFLNDIQNAKTIKVKKNILPAKTKTPKKSLIQKMLPDRQSDQEFKEEMQRPMNLDRDIMELYGGLR